MKGGQLFFELKIKVTMRGHVIVININFYLEVVVVQILIYPCHALSDVIVDTEQDEEKSNLIFVLGTGISDWNSNYSALYFPGFIHAHDMAFLKSQWDNLCFLGFQWTLWMHM